MIVARLRNQTDGNAARLIAAAASHRHAAPKAGHERMQYTVIFGTSNKGGLGLAEAPNALEALAIIEVLGRRGDQVHTITSIWIWL